MPESNRRDNSQRKDTDVHLVVEIDGNPVGYLDLDVERLWTQIHNRKSDGLELEWLDRTQFDSVLRAAVMKRLVARLQPRLYETLGDEIVKTQLDVESFTLKADAVGQTFGKSKSDIDKLVSDSGRSQTDFYNFFWEYLLDERETSDLRKEWKAVHNSSE